MFPPVVVLVGAESAPAPSGVGWGGEVEDPAVAVVLVVASGHDGVLEVAEGALLYDVHTSLGCQTPV